jgi:phosphate-selective porin OprO/OprP
MRTSLTGLIIILTAAFLLAFSGTYAGADPPAPEHAEPAPKTRSWYESLQLNAKEGITTPGGWHDYWLDGLRIDSPEGNFTLKINLTTFVDAGDIKPDDALQAAFPDFEGTKANLRRLRPTALMTIYDWAKAKFQIEFAEVRDIKDIWFQFTKVPLIDHITLGHMKEPLSLEEWTSGMSTTFMERALPVVAFTNGRNIGFRRHAPVLDERMTWAVGAFLNTFSFDSIAEGFDKISDANGYNLTGRITGIPWYEEEGRKLIHLGLSYSHGFRDESDQDSGVELATVPETNLKDDALVDTGKLRIDDLDELILEFALVYGPLSFQGEYFRMFADSTIEGDPDFSGYYAFVSYFLTGEHRIYGKRSGAFFRQIPRQDFSFGEGGWGALELALRYSYINLNDNRVQGGKEQNLTLGLNWFLSRKVRFMFNYTRAEVKDRGKTPVVPEGDADIFQMRFQFEF